jgi:hypothetical protein
MLADPGAAVAEGSGGEETPPVRAGEGKGG